MISATTSNRTTTPQQCGSILMSDSSVVMTGRNNVAVGMINVNNGGKKNNTTAGRLSASSGFNNYQSDVLNGRQRQQQLCNAGGGGVVCNPQVLKHPCNNTTPEPPVVHGSALRGGAVADRAYCSGTTTVNGKSLRRQDHISAALTNGAIANPPMTTGGTTTLKKCPLAPPVTTESGHKHVPSTSSNCMTIKGASGNDAVTGGVTNASACYGNSSTALDTSPAVLGGTANPPSNQQKYQQYYQRQYRMWNNLTGSRDKPGIHNYKYYHNNNSGLANTYTHSSTNPVHNRIPLRPHALYTTAPGTGNGTVDNHTKMRSSDQNGNYNNSEHRMVISNSEHVHSTGNKKHYYNDDRKRKNNSNPFLSNSVPVPVLRHGNNTAASQTVVIANNIFPSGDNIRSSNCQSLENELNGGSGRDSGPMKGVTYGGEVGRRASTRCVESQGALCGPVTNTQSHDECEHEEGEFVEGDDPQHNSSGGDDVCDSTTHSSHRSTAISVNPKRSDKSADNTVPAVTITSPLSATAASV
eukprot:Lankesteria_metandrocarpae@DN9336_c0_g1_i1.p1